MRLMLKLERFGDCKSRQREREGGGGELMCVNVCGRGGGGRYVKLKNSYFIKVVRMRESQMNNWKRQDTG